MVYHHIYTSSVVMYYLLSHERLYNQFLGYSTPYVTIFKIFYFLDLSFIMCESTLGN